MAVIWPRELPFSILSDGRRRAEVHVYERLSEVLSDDFHVFYSSPWLGTDELGNERDGECDFLVAHPEHGILSLEVKGGVEITFDPHDAQWRSKDHAGFVFKIKDPVAQARNAKYQFIQQLNKSKRWRKRFIHAAHGVIFPSARTPTGDLGADRPAHIFCCSQKFRTEFMEWIYERLCVGNRPSNCEALGSDGISALELLLAHPINLSFSLGAVVADAETGFRLLEPFQYQILDSIADIQRALIQGGAGTGKTVMAIQEAVRSAAEGKRTLLTCYSRPLANSLKKKLKGHENLTVLSFHGLCGFAADKAGISISTDVDTREFYETTLPEALFNAMELRPKMRWDAVVVDEAQDFRPHWWLALEECISENGRLRVFADNNQRVYGDTSGFAQELITVPIRLSKNLRNTKKIHNLAVAHYMGPKIIAEGPDGPDVEWITCPDSSSATKLDLAIKKVKALVRTHEVPEGDVAVLVNDPTDQAICTQKLKDAGILFTDADEMCASSVLIDSVRRFKGLERPVVIVVINGHDLDRRELAYVAFSRARSYLCVISADSDSEWLRNPIY